MLLDVRTVSDHWLHPQAFEPIMRTNTANHRSLRSENLRLPRHRKRSHRQYDLLACRSQTPKLSLPTSSAHALEQGKRCSHDLRRHHPDERLRCRSRKHQGRLLSIESEESGIRVRTLCHLVGLLWAPSESTPVHCIYNPPCNPRKPGYTKC